MAIKNSTNENYKIIIIEESFMNPVIVKFSAKWCQPCKIFNPLFEEVANNENFNNYTFVNCDIDQNQELVNISNVKSIPSVLIFENGNITKQVTGNMSINDLEIFITSQI